MNKIDKILKEMEQKEEYRLLSHRKINGLDDLVCGYLKVGWIVYGYPFVKEDEICQAIIRVKK